MNNTNAEKLIQAHGRHYAGGKKVNLCIRLPEDLKAALQKCASERGRDYCDFIREGLDQWAKAHEGK